MRKAAEQLPSLPGEFKPVFDLAARELRLDAAARKVEAVYHEAVHTSTTR